MFESDLTVEVAAVSAGDLDRLDDAALLAGFEELTALEARVRAEQVRWLRAIDARESSVAECGRATRSWLVEEQRLSPGEARRRMLLARGLGELPVTAVAFAAGEISAEHAATIVNGCREVPDESRGDVETVLVELARAAGPQDVARAVDAVRVRFGLDDSAEAAYARRYGERGVELDVTFGGFASLSGTLSPDVAETLRVALEAAAGRVGGEDARSVRQRRHDALGEIAGFFLAHGQLPDDGGERPRVIVTIDHATLLAELTERMPMLDGALLDPAAARRLACDADLLPAVLGSRGEVLDMGRASRVFPTAIRRAAALRDGGRCAFGGCRRPIRECHHIRWWSHGGTTSLDNAAWLCGFHHWLVHDGHWSMRRDTHGYTFTDPNGRAHRFHRQPEAA